MKADRVTQLVGNTPALRVELPELPQVRLWVKLEGANPTGSIKDRACVYNIMSARARGALRPGMTLLDASSGNMACSLAYFGASLGYRVEVVCNSKLTAEKAEFIRFFGADLSLVGDFTIQGNTHCRDVVYPSDPDRYCFLDQLHNWDNPRAHYETTGPELARDFPELTAVVGSLGSGGTMNGVGRYLREQLPAARVICVEAATGVKIPGTGAFDDGDYQTPFIKQGYSEGIFQHRVTVTLADATRWAHALLGYGVFGGLQTGAVVHAAVSHAGEHQLQGDIVALSGDAGWKNMVALSSR